MFMGSGDCDLVAGVCDGTATALAGGVLVTAPVALTFLGCALAVLCVAVSLVS